MFKNYTVIDNFFSNPDEIRDLLLAEKYFKKEDFEIDGIQYHKEEAKNLRGGWRGFRTENLIKKYSDVSEMFNGMVSKMFELPVKAEGELHGHISTERMKNAFEPSTKWHKDTSLFAGVVYLAKNPGPDSGTWLKLKDGVLKHENVYNRLTLYKSDILHSPGEFFGTTAYDSRLTLTFFINSLSFNCRYGNVAEPGLLHRS